MEQHRSPTRRLRLFLRDYRMVEAEVNLADGQSLASFFAAMRKGYINLRAAHWPSTNERVEDAALKVEQVLWAAASGDVPLTMASSSHTGRAVEVQLDGGLLLRARMIVGQQQRLSDYLEAAGKFLPLMDAQLLRSGRPPQRVNVTLGDLVLNQDAIQAVWETATQPVSAADSAEHVVVQTLEETSVSAAGDSDESLTLDVVAADADQRVAGASDDEGVVATSHNWESMRDEAEDAEERHQSSWQAESPRW